MFGLFRTPKPVAAKRPTTRLSLEALECRCVPTALSMNITYNGGTSVTLSGTLSGTPYAQGQTIQFGGEAWGQTTTDANGNYSITENAAGLGQIGAAVPTLSTYATATLTDSGPQLTSFAAIEQTGSWWEFKGTFTYNYTISGMTLTLNGAPVDIQNVHYSLDSSGTFDEWIQLNGKSNDNGMVACYITDAWGVNSNMGYQEVDQTGT
jgi:hypothetical protein